MVIVTKDLTRDLPLWVLMWEALYRVSLADFTAMIIACAFCMEKCFEADRPVRLTVSIGCLSSF